LDPRHRFPRSVFAGAQGPKNEKKRRSTEIKEVPSPSKPLILALEKEKGVGEGGKEGKEEAQNFLSYPPYCPKILKEGGKEKDPPMKKRKKKRKGREKGLHDPIPYHVPEPLLLRRTPIPEDKEEKEEKSPKGKKKKKEGKDWSEVHESSYSSKRRAEREKKEKIIRKKHPQKEKRKEESPLSPILWFLPFSQFTRWGGEKERRSPPTFWRIHGQREGGKKEGSPGKSSKVSIAQPGTSRKKGEGGKLESGGKGREGGHEGEESPRILRK